jgi:hypothetical protein
MTRVPAHRILHEVGQFRRDSGDADLDSITVAIYLEDALDITIPDDLITGSSLTSASGVAEIATRLALDA